MLAPRGIPTLTAPSGLTTGLFLLPLIRFDETDRPDHTDWDPARKTPLAPRPLFEPRRTPKK